MLILTLLLWCRMCGGDLYVLLGRWTRLLLLLVLLLLLWLRVIEIVSTLLALIIWYKVFTSVVGARPDLCSRLAISRRCGTLCILLIIHQLHHRLQRLLHRSQRLCVLSHYFGER